MTHSTRIRVEPRHKNNNKIPQRIVDLIGAKNLARRLAQRTEDNSIWRIAKALRSNRKPLPPIHGTRGLVLSNDEKAQAFVDSL
ncbi:hypothetical protein MTP99_009138 [Tenebrio molitor]|nr:hypothetical protein MTP99_009138 [Tenebrio molitor]